MVTLHHLNNSRSQRIIWLLEELGIPYELKKYERMPPPMPLAPPELKKVHPLGKSPVITDGNKTIAESGAAVDYLIDTYGGGKFKPKSGSDEYWKYVEWLHYAEGSAMLPLMLALYTSRLGEGAAPLQPRIQSEIENHFSYMENAMKGRKFFVGDDLTGADVQMQFVMEAAGEILNAYPSLKAFRTAMQARPAYLRGIEKGGEYALMAR